MPKGKAKSMFKDYSRKSRVGVAEITDDLLTLLQTGGANPTAKVGDFLIQERDEKGNAKLVDGRPKQEIVTAEAFAASGFHPTFGTGKPKSKVAVDTVAVPGAAPSVEQTGQIEAADAVSGD